MSNMLRVCEIFKSIQGESSFAGLICAFVRVSGCNLSCTYCDTPYARTESGTDMTPEQIVDAIGKFSCDLVEITGGEPLLQKATPELCRKLIKNGKTVMVETNGSLNIAVLPLETIKIVDIKCPSSGMCGTFLESNIAHFQERDEIKFVIGSRSDFDWAFDVIEKNTLHEKGAILFSPVSGKINPVDLADWILSTNAPGRLNLQLHKILWKDKRGV